MAPDAWPSDAALGRHRRRVRPCHGVGNSRSRSRRSTRLCRRSPKLPVPIPGNIAIKKLAPVVTNLAGSESDWVRLEASIVYKADEEQNPDVIAAETRQDVLAYIRTLVACADPGSERTSPPEGRSQRAGQAALEGNHSGTGSRDPDRSVAPVSRLRIKTHFRFERLCWRCRFAS